MTDSDSIRGGTAAEPTQNEAIADAKAAAKAEKEKQKEEKKLAKQRRQMQRRRLGDRKEGRRLRSVDPVVSFTPFIMKERSDALIYFSDSINTDAVDRYCRAKVMEGKSNFTLLHVILAAYIRVVSQKPQINRFISGQRIFARRNIEINMVVKKKMTSDSPETCISILFEPTDTADMVYEKFNKVVQDIVNAPDESTSFDKLNGVLNRLPRFLIRFVIWFLGRLDYWGKLPQKLLRLSPFHGSMIITSMGSLGIPPVYHHLYNFGNLPIFISYGIRKIVPIMTHDGHLVNRKQCTLKVVMDERICDGFSFASAFKMLKHIIEKPEVLDTPPECVKEDIY
ncbi:MAG: 2-oxo acid dehydrogenase subunit E2 [Clostridia bacterium]|nr:2-oxo acid dehydrogenase subunit E2 [Clostridia bacterium]